MSFCLLVAFWKVVMSCMVTSSGRCVGPVGACAAGSAVVTLRAAHPTDPIAGLTLPLRPGVRLRITDDAAPTAAEFHAVVVEVRPPPPGRRPPTARGHPAGPSWSEHNLPSEIVFGMQPSGASAVICPQNLLAERFEDY